jgi:chaperonin GroES
MTLRPLGARVLAKRVEEREQTIGGILIPVTAQEKPTQALVVAAGPGRRLESGEIAGLDVKAGDRILLDKYSGSEVKIDGLEYLILREDEILAVLD